MFCSVVCDSQFAFPPHIVEASVPTSAQQRGALHAHILVWLKTRIRSKDWQQLPSVSKTVLGKGSKQKSPQDMPHPELPRDTDGKPITHEDSIYHKFECGRVLGEMVRPDISGQNWGQKSGMALPFS